MRYPVKWLHLGNTSHLGESCVHCLLKTIYSQRLQRSHVLQVVFVQLAAIPSFKDLMETSFHGESTNDKASKST